MRDHPGLGVQLSMISGNWIAASFPVRPGGPQTSRLWPRLGDEECRGFDSRSPWLKSRERISRKGYATRCELLMALEMELECSGQLDFFAKQKLA